MPLLFPFTSLMSKVYVTLFGFATLFLEETYLYITNEHQQDSKTVLHFFLGTVSPEKRGGEKSG